MAIDPLAPLPLPPLGSDPTQGGAFPHHGLVDSIVKAVFGTPISDLPEDKQNAARKEKAGNKAEAGKDAANFANNPSQAAAGYMQAPAPGGGDGSPLDLIKMAAKLFAKSAGLGT